MKKILFHSSYFFLLGILISGQSYAEDEVHFGTIFVEDIEYQNADDKQNINYLTDQSKAQNVLESLYKKEIGEPNKKL